MTTNLDPIFSFRLPSDTRARMEKLVARARADHTIPFALSRQIGDLSALSRAAIGVGLDDLERRVMTAASAHKAAKRLKVKADGGVKRAKAKAGVGVAKKKSVRAKAKAAGARRPR